MSINLEYSSLEKRISNSIFNQNYKVVDSYIGENLKKRGSNFSIPTIQTLLDRSPELEKELIDLYNRKFPMGGTEDIDYEIKLLQASALDGLVVGINTEKDGDYQIYTANVGAIFGVNNESKFNMDKTLELNKKRIVHAVRIDVNYTSEEGFTYKVVSLNKNTNLHIFDVDTFEGKYHLVPYIAIQRSMAFFKEMLDDMRILDICQEKGELTKCRYITCRKDTLVKYCDSEEFAKSLKPSFYPLKGFFYAPVVGAGSLTAGVTRVDLLDVSNIKNVTNIENIAKPKGGVDDVIVESSLMTILTRLYNSEYEEDITLYKSIIDKCPNSRNLLTGAVNDVEKGVPSPVTMVKYLHSLNGKERDKFLGLIPDLDEEVSKKKGVLTGYEELNPADYSIEDIQIMLRNGIYKFHLRKKDCHYSSITVSNDVSILKKIYGDDYFAKYESFGVRLRKFEGFLDNNAFTDDEDRIKIWLDYCGLPSDENTLDKLVYLWGTFSGNELHEELLSLFGNKSASGKRKSTRRSSSNDSLVLSRVCLASISSSGVVDFYRYLDMSKVVAMYRLG